MTKGTKVFRIIISILLALTMIVSAFFIFVFCLDFGKSPYGIYVSGIAINRSNNEDVLGDRSEERRVGKECRSRGSPYH